MELSPAPELKPGPPQVQLDATLAWVTRTFGDYYARNPLPPPSRHARREFGFIWNGEKGFLRHLAFPHQDTLQDFLARRGPHHAYYSTAFYRQPNAPTMKDKEWLGADLIFDLDADHLPGADALSLRQQLAAVKVQAEKLLDEYLMGDFGFKEEHIRIVFSGGRGYHFHVTDPRAQQLDSAGRREIVDYVSPSESLRDVLVESWAKDETVGHDNAGRPITTTRVPTENAGGWPSILTRSFCNYLDALRVLPEADALARLQELDGIGKKRAANLIQSLQGPHAMDRIKRIRTQGYLQVGLRDLAKPTTFRAILGTVVVDAAGETDGPVTADVKRLIRLPHSLHGKTGLRVTPLSIPEFRAFDPLRDAIALGTRPVSVEVSRPFDIPLGDEPLHVEPGPATLPECAAMFLILKRAALLTGGPP